MLTLQDLLRTRTAQPPLNKAMYFNGVNAYVYVPASSSLVFDSDFTVCVWVIPTGVYYGWTGVVDNGRNYVNNWWFLTQNGVCGFLWGIGFTDGTIAEHYLPTVSPYTFKHYCFGVQGNTMLSCIDGKLYATSTFTKTRAVYSRPVELGCKVHASAFTNVYIAQLLIYRGRMLSSSEVLHNALNPNNPVRDNLVLWLDARACDASKNICWDLSNNNNNGTMYNVQIVSLPNPVRVGGSL